MDSRKNIFGFSDSNFRRGSGFLLIYYRIYGSVLESLRIFGFTISPLIHFLFLDDFLWITRRNFRQMYISRFLMVKAKPWTPEIRVKRQNGNIKEIHVSDPDLEKNMFGFSDFCKYLVGFSDPAHPLGPAVIYKENNFVTSTIPNIVSNYNYLILTSNKCFRRSSHKFVLI